MQIFPTIILPKKPYDLSGEASRRPGDDPATSISRELESDDVNEQTISSQLILQMMMSGK